MSDEENVVNDNEIVENEETIKDEDLFNRDYSSMLDLIIACERAILLMKSYINGNDPNSLLAFTEKLMNKFDSEAKKIERKEKFQDKLEKEEENVDNKLDKVKLNYRIKRKKYIIKRKKKLQKKMFKLFKEKILLKEIEKLNKKKSQVNQQKEITYASNNNLRLETQQTNDCIKQLNAPKKS